MYTCTILFLFTTYLNYGFQDRVGFNLAGLQFVQSEIEQSQETIFFTDATDRFREKKKKQKKKAILAIKT